MRKHCWTSAAFKSFARLQPQQSVFWCCTPRWSSIISAGRKPSNERSHFPPQHMWVAHLVNRYTNSNHFPTGKLYNTFCSTVQNCDMHEDMLHLCKLEAQNFFLLLPLPLAEKKNCFHFFLHPRLSSSGPSITGSLSSSKTACKIGYIFCDIFMPRCEACRYNLRVLLKIMHQLQPLIIKPIDKVPNIVKKNQRITCAVNPRHVSRSISDQLIQQCLSHNNYTSIRILEGWEGQAVRENLRRSDHKIRIGLKISPTSKSSIRDWALFQIRHRHNNVIPLRCSETG